MIDKEIYDFLDHLKYEYDLSQEATIAKLVMKYDVEDLFAEAIYEEWLLIEQKRKELNKMLGV